MNKLTRERERERKRWTQLLDRATLKYPSQSASLLGVYAAAINVPRLYRVRSFIYGAASTTLSLSLSSSTKVFQRVPPLPRANRPECIPIYCIERRRSNLAIHFREPPSQSASKHPYTLPVSLPASLSFCRGWFGLEIGDREIGSSRESNITFALNSKQRANNLLLALSSFLDRISNDSPRLRRGRREQTGLWGKIILDRPRKVSSLWANVSTKLKAHVRSHSLEISRIWVRVSSSWTGGGSKLWPFSRGGTRMTVFSGTPRWRLFLKRVSNEFKPLPLPPVFFHTRRLASPIFPRSCFVYRRRFLGERTFRDGNRAESFPLFNLVDGRIRSRARVLLDFKRMKCV